MLKFEVSDIAHIFESLRIYCSNYNWAVFTVFCEAVNRVQRVFRLESSKWRMPRQLTTVATGSCQIYRLRFR